MKKKCAGFSTISNDKIINIFSMKKCSVHHVKAEVGIGIGSAPEPKFNES
jgi:hypothetical protein